MRHRLNQFLLLVALLTVFGLGALACVAVNDDKSVRAPEDTPDPGGGLVVIDDPKREWGLWFGTLAPAGWWFEQAPTSATMSPHLAIFRNGTAAVVSTRVVPPDESGEAETQQALYLTYRAPYGEWIDSSELLRSSPAPSFTAILAASDGMLHVLYGYDGRALHLIIGLDEIDGRLIDDASSTVTHGTLAEDPVGQIHAIYGGWGLTHQIYAEGQWSISYTFEDGDYPDFVFDANGVGHLVFLVSRGLNAGYELNYFTYNPQRQQAWIGGPVLSSTTVQPAPRVAVDSLGQAQILTPSDYGLLYVTCQSVQDGSCLYEVAAGQDWSAGYEYADLVMTNDEPVAVYRDANTADGFVGRRHNDRWSWRRFDGFEDGFIGLDLELNPAGLLTVVFSGWKTTSNTFD